MKQTTLTRVLEGLDSLECRTLQLDLQWITEAKPSQSSHVGNPTYTRTDSYEYILETDTDGNIFGGEYIGRSRENHPDFVWWPTSKPNGRIADGLITYDNVKMLNDKAAGITE